MKSKQVILPHQNYRFQYYENETIENYWEKMKKLPQSIWTFPLKFNQHGHVPIECLDSKKISLTKKELYPDLFVRQQARTILPVLSVLPALPRGGGVAAWGEPVHTPRVSPGSAAGTGGGVGQPWDWHSPHLFMGNMYSTWKLGSPPRERRHLRERERNNAGKIWHCLSADQSQRMIPQQICWRVQTKTINCR